MEGRAVVPSSESPGGLRWYCLSVVVVVSSGDRKRNQRNISFFSLCKVNCRVF